MKKHLTARDREAIIGLLAGWPPETKLTWQRLVNRIEERLGFSPTRQTLARHPQIKKEFRILKDSSPPVQPSQSERILREHVERVTKENIRLSEDNRCLYQMFAQWQYRLYLRGITENMLEEMQSERLPRIDRDRTD